MNTSTLIPPSSPHADHMHGKPVLHREAKTVLTIPSLKFQEKCLCDGIVLNLGDACVFNCRFCYVGAGMIKIDKPIIDAHNHETGQDLGFEDVVIRRRNAIPILRSQLLKPDGSRIYDDPDDNRIAFTSTSVDVAANMELLKETAEACNLILEHTNWEIRILSKSPLLKLLVERCMIPEKYHHRLIFGFSTGTLDDKLAAAIECGTGLVSKRIEALHWLQDQGIRTFGMICPSLPQEDYHQFSKDICAAIRVEKCEHVWAEVINVRGQSLTKTLDALRAGGFEGEAQRLEAVAGAKAKQQWEEYARMTFIAHSLNVPPDKLRFLQYVDAHSAPWWRDYVEHGAVLLGKEAEKQNLITVGESAPTPQIECLGRDDIEYREHREEIVRSGVKASIAAAKALHEIHSYKNGALWKTDFTSFEAYCSAKWGYAKAHSYRLLQSGGFIAELESSQSPNGDLLPVNEGQVRPLLAIVPKEHRVACWNTIVADKVSAELTGKTVAAEARRFVKDHDLDSTAPKPEKPNTHARAIREIDKLRAILGKLPQPERFEQLLIGIAVLVDQDPAA